MVRAGKRVLGNWGQQKDECPFCFLTDLARRIKDVPILRNSICGNPYNSLTEQYSQSIGMIQPRKIAKEGWTSLNHLLGDGVLDSELSKPRYQIRGQQLCRHHATKRPERSFADYAGYRVKRKANSSERSPVYVAILNGSTWMFLIFVSGSWVCARRMEMPIPECRYFGTFFLTQQFKESNKMRRRATDGA